jgi:hypothetical protein
VLVGCRAALDNCSLEGLELNGQLSPGLAAHVELGALTGDPELAHQRTAIQAQCGLEGVAGTFRVPGKRDRHHKRTAAVETRHSGHGPRHTQGLRAHEEADPRSHIGVGWSLAK